MFCVKKFVTKKSPQFFLIRLLVSSKKPIWIHQYLVNALSNLISINIKREIWITVSTIDVFNGVCIDQCINSKNHTWFSVFSHPNRHCFFGQKRTQMHGKRCIKVNFSNKWTKLDLLEALYHTTSKNIYHRKNGYREVHKPRFYFGAELTIIPPFVDLQATNTISCH